MEQNKTKHVFHNFIAVYEPGITFLVISLCVFVCVREREKVSECVCIHNCFNKEIKN